MTKRSKSAALDDLKPLNLWAAWKLEPGVDGAPPLKVAYVSKTKRARSNDSSGWLTYADARRLAKEEGFDGLAILLGDLDGGVVFAGLDLDTCRDPTTGAIDPWASKVIAKFHSYAEISPSKTGVKIFVKVAARDRKKLLALLKRHGTKRGKKWSKRGLGAHPPAIEFYAGLRYFTVTGRPL